MVQDQLVEYVSSQLKAGVSADAVRAALVGAGWQPIDVDDTMKKVQSGAGPAAPAAAVAAASVTTTVAAAQPKTVATTSSPASSSTASGPQVIRVSDLASSSGMGASMSSAKTDSVISKINAGTAKVSEVSPVSPMKEKKSHAFLTEGVLGILLIVCAASAIFFFFENKGLSDQIASLNAQSGGVSSQLSALQSQMNATTTALEGQVASAQAQNSQLALELSFYAVPPTTTSTSVFTSALEGMVSGGGAKAYTIMTADGAKISVANSKDPRVVNLLQPLIGSTTTSQFSGNYTPGIPSITLTAVNGLAVSAPAAATTTSGATGAPMIPASSTPGQ